MAQRAWLGQLRDSSFRGVPFFTADRSGTGGRRNVHFEFPKRDDPDSEDMGRRQRFLAPIAYVLGSDYMAARDRLIDALEKGGPGTYVDHFGKEHRVVVDDYDYRETSQDGGYCEFHIAFAEAGQAGGAPRQIAAAAFASLAPLAAGVVTSAVSSFRSRYGR